VHISCFMFYRCYNGQPTDNTFYDILYERLNIYKIIYFLPYVYVFGDPTLIFVAITKSLIHLNDFIYFLLVKICFVVQCFTCILGRLQIDKKMFSYKISWITNVTLVPRFVWRYHVQPRGKQWDTVSYSQCPSQRTKVVTRHVPFQMGTSCTAS